MELATQQQAQQAPTEIRSFSLYEISCDYQKLYDFLMASIELGNEEGHEADDEALINTLESIEDSFKNKCVNTAIFIKNFEALAGNIREAERRMAERRRCIENKIDKFKAYLKENMQKCNILNITDSPYLAIRIQNCPASLKIEAGAAIPEQYIRRKISEEPDKNLIIKAIQQGEEIKGVSIVKNKTLIIR